MVNKNVTRIVLSYRRLTTPMLLSTACDGAVYRATHQQGPGGGRGVHILPSQGAPRRQLLPAGQAGSRAASGLQGSRSVSAASCICVEYELTG